MNKELFEKYLKERYEDQLDYYNRKAMACQKKYKQFQWALIILSAITPVLAALEGKSFAIAGISFSFANIQILVIIVSAIVAILTTGSKTFNYQELWITYRSTYEKLKPELYYYNFSIGPYGAQGIDKESLFVSRVEAMFDSEHNQWPVAKQMRDGQQEDDKTNANGNGSLETPVTKKEEIKQFLQ